MYVEKPFSNSVVEAENESRPMAAGAFFMGRRSSGCSVNPSSPAAPSCDALDRGLIFKAPYNGMSAAPMHTLRRRRCSVAKKVLRLLSDQVATQITPVNSPAPASWLNSSGGFPSIITCRKQCKDSQ